jgi:hypothetical protein
MNAYPAAAAGKPAAICCARYKTAAPFASPSAMPARTDRPGRTADCASAAAKNFSARPPHTAARSLHASANQVKPPPFQRPRPAHAVRQRHSNGQKSWLP